MKRRCLLLVFNLLVAGSAPAAVEVEYVPTLPAIKLPLGQTVAVQLNDAELWQSWIERKAKGAGGRGSLPPEFKDVAATFKKVGEEMNVFWPGALVQSVLETGYYQYKGDVPRHQHGFNVAGVGITKEEGKRVVQDFKTLENGVRAFFQHLQIYAGEPPKGRIISDRTRSEQRAIAGKVKALMSLPERGGAAVRFIDLGAPPIIDPLTDPKKPRAQRKRTPGFIAMAVNYAGTIEKYNAMLAAYLDSGIGGGGLRYAGDPLYAWKWYLLWNDARASIEADWIKKQKTKNSQPPQKTIAPPWGNRADPGIPAELVFRRGALRPQSIYPGANGQFWIYQSARSIYQLPGRSQGWTLVAIKLGKPSVVGGSTLYANSEITVKRNPGKVDADQEPAKYLVIRRSPNP